MKPKWWGAPLKLCQYILTKSVCPGVAAASGHSASCLPATTPNPGLLVPSPVLSLVHQALFHQPWENSLARYGEVSSNCQKKMRVESNLNTSLPSWPAYYHDGWLRPMTIAQLGDMLPASLGAAPGTDESKHWAKTQHTLKLYHNFSNRIVLFGVQVAWLKWINFKPLKL